MLIIKTIVINISTEFSDSPIALSFIICLVCSVDITIIPSGNYKYNSFEEANK